MMKPILNEQQARAGLECIACRGEKDKGLLVCWKCFKAPIDGLKYSGLSFEEWQTTFGVSLEAP